MSEPKNPNSSGGGFEEEGADNLAAEPKERPAAKPRKSDEMMKNFKAVFGHGVGKVSLIIAVVIILVLGALAVNGLTKKDNVVNGKPSKVDAPRAPQPEVSVDPISESEAARRAQVSAQEAQRAANNGESYQPGFDPNIVANSSTDFDSGKNGAFNVPGQPAAVGNQQNGQIRVGAGQPTDQASAAAQAQAQAQGTAAQNAKDRADAAQKERERIQKEYEKAVADRDKYVSDIRNQVLKQYETMAGASEGAKGFTQKSSFSTVSYHAVEKSVVDQKGNIDLVKAEDAKDPDAIPTVGDKRRPLLVKTGNIMYATLDSEINTDDGGDVLATVRGGKWNGSKVIGKIEQGANNIRARFTILAPQDGRQTMRINAIALREEDAKQGIADDIDSHLTERYFALGAASLLQGYGRAYQQTAGTTVISPSGVVAQTTTEPSTKQVIGSSVGELGSSVASEVRRGFNRPTTYSTPANKGFGLFFMQDVYEQSR
uniref:DotG/IcmE/VirB10 family protein n=1 Tax=Pseudomonas syringae TaxID=317 RepID=UPI001E4A7DCD|nr:DotG/IcmE/VirB10 family protein [Pseudomonas syringae]QOQ33365.1 hypothetical protein [Pseudomonas syringae pv. actinidiae]